MSVSRDIGNQLFELLRDEDTSLLCGGIRRTMAASISEQVSERLKEPLYDQLWSNMLLPVNLEIHANRFRIYVTT